MGIDWCYLYENMLRSRLFEEAVQDAWEQGLISGEMHLSIGEEAIVAGTVLQLQDGDAMALDHRGTSPMVMRGVALVSLLREFLGHPDGLCGGQGGHMHLFDREHLIASSGIVGASGPAAVGFALAARRLRPGKVAVAFFGEGAMNQGMLMEALNLAVVWRLPVVFVCKDSKWAITTISTAVTGGSLTDRARSFGMPAVEIDGSNVEAVHYAAQQALERARNATAPTFIRAHCWHPEGHFLGDPLFRMTRHPVRELKKTAGPLLKSVTRKSGATPLKRSAGLGTVSRTIAKTAIERTLARKDPLRMTRNRCIGEQSRLQQLEDSIRVEIETVFRTACSPPGSDSTDTEVRP